MEENSDIRGCLSDFPKNPKEMLLSLSHFFTSLLYPPAQGSFLSLSDLQALSCLAF